MTQPLIETDPALRGGHALIRIAGGAAKGLTDPRFRLSREGFEAGTLGLGGWQVAEALLTPISAKADGGNLVLSVGPSVVDLVESGVVTLAVPSIAFDEPVFWPELPLSRGGQTGAMTMNQAQAIPRPPPIEIRTKVEQPAPASVPHVVAPPAAVPRPVLRSAPPPVAPVVPLAAARALDPGATKLVTRSRLPWLAVCLLMAAAGAGDLWWKTHHQAGSPNPPVPPRDCAAGSIQQIVACAPDANALYRLAQQRWDHGHVNDGLVLMQIAADHGSGEAALKLAQLYDPATYRPGGPILHASTREAAQYYRRAVQAHQAGVDGPREALRRRLQGDADSGDSLAGLTIKDFWP